MEEQSVLHFLSLSLFVYFSFHFYSSLVFLWRTSRVKGRYGGTATCVGLGCMSEIPKDSIKKKLRLMSG